MGRRAPGNEASTLSQSKGRVTVKCPALRTRTRLSAVYSYSVCALISQVPGEPGAYVVFM